MSSQEVALTDSQELELFETTGIDTNFRQIAVACEQLLEETPVDSDTQNRIVQRLIEIQASQNKVRLEQMAIAASLLEIQRELAVRFNEAYGLTAATHQKTLTAFYKLAEAVVGLKKNTIYGYLRVHAKFMHRTDAIDAFTFSDLTFLVRDDLDEATIDQLVSMKQADASLSRSDIRAFLRAKSADTQAARAAADQFQAEVMARDRTIDRLTRENTEFREKLADARANLENAENIRSQLTTKLDSQLNALASHETVVGHLKRQIAEVNKKEVTTQSHPGSVRDRELVAPESASLAEDIREQASQLRLATEATATARATVAELQKQIAAQNAEIAAAKELEKAISEVMSAADKLFANFARVQLIHAAHAGPKTSFKPLLQSLAERILLLHQETAAAVRTLV